jgi:hypothetical protein
LIPAQFRETANAFAKAWFWSGVAGALPFLLVAVPVGTSLIGQGQTATAVWTMILPLLVSWPITFIGMIALGVPIGWLFARSGHERGRFYILAGLIAGSLPFLIAGLFPDAIGWMAFSIPGGLAGAVAGWHWGRHRDRVATHSNSN